MPIFGYSLIRTELPDRMIKGDLQVFALLEKLSVENADDWAFVVAQNYLEAERHDLFERFEDSLSFRVLEPDVMAFYLGSFLLYGVKASVLERLSIELEQRMARDKWDSDANLLVAETLKVVKYFQSILPHACPDDASTFASFVEAAITSRASLVLAYRAAEARNISWTAMSRYPHFSALRRAFDQIPDPTEGEVAAAKKLADS